VQTFKTTEKGLRFLETYNWLDDLIREEGELETSTTSITTSHVDTEEKEAGSVLVVTI
jgi:hypothetical protein